MDQLDVTCFIISLFTAQHVSNVSASIFRSLRFIVDLFHVLYCSGSTCVGVTVWFGWGGVVSLCRLKRSFIRELGRLISFGSAEQISLTDLLKDVCRRVPESFTFLTDGWKARVTVRVWSSLVTHTVRGQPSLTAVPLCDLPP